MGFDFASILRERKREIVIIIAIFLLAFGIRAYMMRYELFFEFDSYFHARVAGYFADSLTIPQNDPLAYTTAADSLTNLHARTANFFWLMTGGLYKLLTFWMPFDKNLWIGFVKVYPALFGALIAAAMYFLGKELYDRRAGIAFGFFAAIAPSFVYRTMAGFFEEDSLGFLWMVIGFVFFVRAVKQDSFFVQKSQSGIRLDWKAAVNPVLAGLFYGMMSWTWEMFLLIPIIMAGYIVFAIPLSISKTGGYKSALNITGNFVIAMGIFTFFTVFISRIEWITRIIGQVTVVIPPNIVPVVGLAALGALGIAAFSIYYATRKIKLDEETGKTIRSGVMLAMYALIGVMLITVFINQSLRDQNVLGLTVGEENTGIQFFGEKFNALIILPALALLIIPFRIMRKPDDTASQLVFIWILVTLFMAWYKLKFTYAFGLPIAAAAGVVFIEVLDFLSKRNLFEKKLVGLSLAFIVLIGVGAASIFITTKAPNIETTPGWKETLYWLKDNTPEDAQMFNWWDEGHWISFIGERKVITDNRNLDGQANAAYARFALSTSEDEALTLVTDPAKVVQTDRTDFGPYNADYVIISRDLISKTGSLNFYAYNTTDPNDPRFQGYFGVALDCSPLNSLSQEKNYNCNGNMLTSQQLQGIPTTWIPVENQLIAENTPGFVYRDSDNSKIYIMNRKTNNTMIARLWLADPSITHFDEVFSKGDVKVLKVVR